MKRISGLGEPTPGLVDYCECEEVDASWEGFRNHHGGAAYRELVETLQNVQRGLCGYCEIDITELDRQVEHVVPQSAPQQGMRRSLDHTNLMVCCKGGTIPPGLDDNGARRLIPIGCNRSCGEAKGDLVDAEFVDPRKLPSLPSLTHVRLDGEISADKKACLQVNVDPRHVNKTIDILGLNVERLKLLREKRWRSLKDSWEQHYDNPQLMVEAARQELLPSDDGNLPRFFTTSRSFFAPVGEAILAQNPSAWI